MELISPVFVNTVAIIAAIAGLSIAVWWIISLYSLHSREVESKLPQVGLPEELGEVLTGIPPALTVFFILILLSLPAYVLYIWLGGVVY